MRNSITTTVSRLPKPLRWTIYAIGGFLLLQAVATALAITSFVLGLAIKGAFVLTVGAVVLIMMRKR